jgi:hypothetical protein
MSWKFCSKQSLLLKKKWPREHPVWINKFFQQGDSKTSQPMCMLVSPEAMDYIIILTSIRKPFHNGLELGLELKGPASRLACFP